MTRKSQIGPVTGIILTMLSLTFVIYMMTGSQPLFMKLYGCFASTTADACSGLAINTGITGYSINAQPLYILLAVVVVGMIVTFGLLAFSSGISLGNTAFPNPYLYFIPVFVLLIFNMLLPSQLFTGTEGYPLPSSVSMFIIVIFNMIIGIGAASWLKGGGLP